MESQNEKPEIFIYTDGAARGNPGPGGFGIVLKSGSYRKEISQGYRLTTNNRMELMGAIVGIEALKIEHCKVTIYTDSKYVVDSVEKRWIFNWMKKDFKGKKNSDLWKRYIEISGHHFIKFVWVKGHSGLPENERCDNLAVAASFQPNLLEDKGYLIGN